MKTQTTSALTCAGLLALAGACASSGQQSAANPTANTVQASQAQTEEALKRAQDAQKRAIDQEKRAVAAQQDVQRAQQQLTQAQQRARDEQAKAEQLQAQANEMMRASGQEVQQGQEQASKALSVQGKQVEQAQQSFAGRVQQMKGDQLSVAPPGGGQPMLFKVTDQTRVLIDGRPASASEIVPGEDARVAYQVGGVTPSAISVQVMTGNPVAPGTGSGSPQGTGSGTGQQ